MNGKKRIQSALLLIVVFAPALLLFQNCSPAKVSSSSSTSSSSIAPTSNGNSSAAPTSTPTPTPTPTPAPKASPTPPVNLATAVKTRVGACLSIYQGLVGDGAPLIQDVCAGGSDQQFFFLSQGSSNYQIVSNISSKCFDVGGTATADGSTVVQWACIAGALNQTWQFMSNSDGSFKLKDQNSQKCLTYPAYDGSGSLSQQLYILPCSSVNTNQNFSF